MEKLLTLKVDTTTFPAHPRHMDDDTVCTSPDACGRMVYWRGGRPEHPDNNK
jgi:hypothetical protein